MWLDYDKPYNGFTFQNKIKCHYKYKKTITAAINKDRNLFSNILLN